MLKLSSPPASGAFRLYGLACVLIGWSALPTTLAAQDAPPPRVITAVEFTGVTASSLPFAQDVVRVRVGDRLDVDALQAAVVRLIRADRFIAANFRVEDTDGGVRVVFDLNERAVITALRFEGNAELSDARLRDVVDPRVSAPVELYSIRDGQLAIETLYRDAGYRHVTVAFDADLLERSGALVYTIVEGRQVRIREIRFEGNDGIDERKLRKHVQTNTAFWFIRTGAFDPDRVAADVLRLQRLYRDEGFLDATVSVREEVSADGDDMTVVFTVAEGTQYKIEDVTFQGNADLSTQELQLRMASLVGEVVNRPRVEADARAIQLTYAELGYIHATVEAMRVFSNTPGLVRITIKINEGEQFRIGRIAVRGNTRTQDKVVRRELHLYPPDDLFNLVEARAAERRLTNTRIFTAARVIPVGNEPGVRDAVIDVTEADKAGDFVFELGLSSNSGVIGRVVLDLQNFDLLDTPRNLSEILKLRAFHGAGQRLRIALQPGTTVSQYRVDFTEPYLFDKPTRFEASTYFWERRRENYIEGRTGATLSFGKQLRRGRWRGWFGELAFRAESVKIGDIDLFASSELRDDKGNNLITSAKVSLVRDRRDNRFIPTSGDRIDLSYEHVGVLGGDHNYGKLKIGYRWFKTLSTDRLNRKRVVHLRAEGGVIVGNAPVFDRFFAGGTGSLRGFAFRGVGERDGIDNTNIGGDYLLLLSAEYRFPLYGEKLRGNFFLDTGAVGSGTYRAAIGTGIRFTINIPNPVPIELNLAIPISRGSDDDVQALSLVFGGAF